jgi:hypothetical protein
MEHKLNNEETMFNFYGKQCFLKYRYLFLVYSFGRLECVSHSFAYVAHIGLLRDV